jgi:hypothetical protein
MSDASYPAEVPFVTTASVLYCRCLVKGESGFELKDL